MTRRKLSNFNRLSSRQPIVAAVAFHSFESKAAASIIDVNLRKSHEFETSRISHTLGNKPFDVLLSSIEV